MDLYQTVPEAHRYKPQSEAAAQGSIALEGCVERSA